MRRSLKQPRRAALLLVQVMLLCFLAFLGRHSYRCAAFAATGRAKARNHMTTAPAPSALAALGAGDWDAASMQLAAGDATLMLDSLPGGLGSVAALAAAAALLLFSTTLGSKKREDGFRDEELPPWANMLQVIADALSGKPFDVVLLNMRARHGDAFRIYIPSLFGETIVLMGLEANQFVFTEQDKNLDQALGGVVGTAVSGKKTMGTKERKGTESGQIFDKASHAFFSNKNALNRATKIFVDSAEVFCDRMARECGPKQNVFELLWKYVVQTNADMLYGEGEHAGAIVCQTIDSINKEGLFSPQVRRAGDDLRTVLDRRYMDRKEQPEKYANEDSLFEEFFKLSGGNADPEMLQGLQQFMLTLQLAANGNQLVTIRWLMSHVYADSAILQEVRREVHAKLLQKGSDATLRSLTLDDLLDLRLTNACITEAVRLHSDIPSKLTLRSAEIDMEFKGFKIPKGSTVFLYADAVHRDDKFFPQSSNFCPHRYTDPEAFNKMQRDREIVAFGHGRKRCTGELHARAQISALLASFVLRYDMDLVTKVPGNVMPEDHDGPFIFDTANTLELMNLRPASYDITSRAEPAAELKEPALAAAAFQGQRVPLSATSLGTAVLHNGMSQSAGAPADTASKCPFSMLKGT